MSAADKVFQDAISLEPIEQAKLVGHLIAVLDSPDPEMDKLWAHEAESRVEGFKSGKLKAVSIEHVLSKCK